MLRSHLPCLHLAALLLGLFSLASVQAGLAQAPLHIKNFGRVNDHILRGAEPGEAGLKELAAMRVVLDLDLREAGEVTEAERRVAEGLGMRYVNVPMRGLSAPRPADIRRVLALLSVEDAGTTFVHCRRGKDRTGTVIACYRIQHDGWSHGEAQGEANRYGMSWTERAMRSFVAAFHATDLPAASVPER